MVSEPGLLGVFPGPPDLAKAEIPCSSAGFLVPRLEGLTPRTGGGRDGAGVIGKSRVSNRRVRRGVLNFF